MTFRIKKDWIKTTFKNLFRFAQVGIFITFLSLMLSFFFLKIVGTPLIITYVILYIAMIFLSFLLNSRYTFKSKMNLKKILLYYGSYVLTMLFGVLLLSIFRRVLPFENWILAYLVIPFTMTANFIFSSFIFKSK
jgi:putative flippase GtrA